MPVIPLVQWSHEQQEQLKEACKHHPKPYVREKCAALLKLAEGRSAREIAQSGLLTPHAQDTLTDWVLRYQQEGLPGLEVQKGRGRKPAFSPGGADQGAGTRSDCRNPASGPPHLRPGP